MPRDAPGGIPGRPASPDALAAPARVATARRLHPGAVRAKITSQPSRASCVRQDRQPGRRRRRWQRPTRPDGQEGNPEMANQPRDEQAPGSARLRLSRRITSASRQWFGKTRPKDEPTKPTLLLLPGDANLEEEQAFLDELEQTVRFSFRRYRATHEPADWVGFRHDGPARTKREKYTGKRWSLGVR